MDKYTNREGNTSHLANTKHFQNNYPDLCEFQLWRRFYRHVKMLIS